MKRCKQTWMALITFAAMAAFVGCPKPAPPAAGPGEGSSEEGHEHIHAAHGPHDGHLIELGDGQYHAELAHDDATGKITIYLLDDVAKKSVPTDAKSITINLVAGGEPKQYTLPAVPDDADPAGQSSRFELADEDLHAAIESEDVKGRVNVTIAGKDLVGEIEHAAHDHEEHGHEDHKDENHKHEDHK